MSTEGNFENLDEDDIDGSGQISKEKTSESSDAEDSIKERSMPEFRKVNTMPSALHNRSEWMNQLFGLCSSFWSSSSSSKVCLTKATGCFNLSPDQGTRETGTESSHIDDVAQKRSVSCLWLVVARFWIFAQKKQPIRNADTKSQWDFFF